MSEAGFIAFNMAFSAVVEALYAGCLALYLRPFLPRRHMPVLVFGACLLLRLLWDGSAIPKGMFGLLLIALPTAASGALGLGKRMAFLLALLFCAGFYLTIAFQQRMEELREEQAALYAERQQAQAIRARIHEAEQFYTRVRELKHEMRGCMANIKGLAGWGKYASLEDYIAKMDGAVCGFDLTLQTGNPVTDVIVNDIRRQSLDLGIRFQAEFHYPDPGAYDAFDVGIILQNLLRNAVEACGKVREGERFIAPAGKRKGRFFLIEVKNSFAGEVVFGQDGLPVTTKREDAPMHGIGLSNVRREAEKYFGKLELKAAQREFSAFPPRRRSPGAGRRSAAPAAPTPWTERSGS